LRAIEPDEPPPPDGEGRDFSGAVRREYASSAAAYDARWAHYLARSSSATLDALSPPPGVRLLDVGCGTGILLGAATRRDPSAGVYGIDLVPEMLERAARRGAGRWHLALGDAKALPFADACFDAVASSSSFHHWAEPRLALGEIARVLRPGGRLVLTDWCRDDLLFRPFALYLRLSSPAVHHVYSVAEARALLESAGFRSVSVARFRIRPLWGMMTLTARAD
jgi:ubiquinone/menaquinone biosynthesis C-methylase UbiE